MKEQPVTFASNGNTLAGTVHIAEGSEEGVIMLPGWAGTRYGPQRIMVESARAMTEAGRTSLRFDFGGRGDSTGDPASVTLDGMIEDVLAGVNWLEENQGVKKVSFLGLCAGANIGIGAASLVPDKTVALIAWSILPFMEHKAEVHGKANKTRSKFLKHYLRKAFDPAAWKKLLKGEANVKGAMDTLTKDKEGDDEEKDRKTSKRDIMKEFEKFAGRTFMVFGTQDPEAADSSSFFETWLKEHGKAFETKWITGAPHNFYTADWTKKVIEMSVEFVNRDA